MCGSIKTIFVGSLLLISIHGVANSGQIFVGSVEAVAIDTSINPDTTDATNQVLPQSSPISIAVSTSNGNSYGNASLQNSVSGIHVAASGYAASSPGGNSIGFQGRGFSNAGQWSEYVVNSASLPNGSPITLSVSFEITGLLTSGGNLFANGGTETVYVGPIVGYGAAIPTLFSNYEYQLSTGNFELTTPGTLHVAINDVGGQPIATQTGSLHTEPYPYLAGTMSISDTLNFDVTVITGEPFLLGVGVRAEVDGGIVGNGPPFGGQSSLDVSVSPVTAVPEPSLMVMLGTGLVILPVLLRSRKSTSSQVV